MDNLFKNLTRHNQLHAQVHVYDNEGGYTSRIGGYVSLHNQSFIVNARGRFQFRSTTTYDNNGGRLVEHGMTHWLYANRVELLRIEV